MPLINGLRSVRQYKPTELKPRVKALSNRLTNYIYKKIDSKPSLQRTINFASKNYHYIGAATIVLTDAILRPISNSTGLHFGFLQNNLGDIGSLLLGMGTNLNFITKSDKGKTYTYLVHTSFFIGLEFLSLNHNFVNCVKSLGLNIGTVFDPYDILAFCIGGVSAMVVDKLAARHRTGMISPSPAKDPDVPLKGSSFAEPALR